MRVKTMLALLALFGALSAGTAFAGIEDLTGIEWYVVDIRYEDGQMRETLPNTNVSLLFSDNGHVSGSAGCNRYSAPYIAKDRHIKIGPAGSTRKLCAFPKGVMEQEAAFLRALENAARFNNFRGWMALFDSEGNVILTMADSEAQAARRRLTGLWLVESIGGKKLLPGTEITMNFTEDGRVAGKATVNNYFSSWIEADGLILFTQAGSTMMAGPEAHMRQEDKFLKLLSKVRKYRIDWDDLTLKTADGELIRAVRAVAE